MPCPQQAAAVSGSGNRRARHARTSLRQQGLQCVGPTGQQEGAAPMNAGLHAPEGKRRHIRAGAGSGVGGTVEGKQENVYIFSDLHTYRR